MHGNHTTAEQMDTAEQFNHQQTTSVLNAITQDTCQFTYDEATDSVVTDRYLRGPVAQALANALNDTVKGDNGEKITTIGNPDVNRRAKNNLLNMQFKVSIPASIMSYDGLARVLLYKSDDIKEAIEEGQGMAKKIREQEASLPKAMQCG